MAGELLAQVLLEAMKFSQVMARAQAEGRAVTAAEIEQFRDGLLESDTLLEAAIQKARIEGR